MKIIIIALVIAAITMLSAYWKQRKPKSSTVIDNPQTLEEKLEVLKSCGLQLAPPFTIKDLLNSWDRKEYESPGYELTLVGLAMTEEEEPWRFHSKNLWHFDTECIEDHGSYKQIAERMVEMSQGSLRLDDIKDYVDVEHEKAWLSFNFKGRPMKFNLKVEDDWVDATIFGKFVELLRESDSSKIFIYYDLEGQDCLIGCVKKSELECLQSKGLKFVPLH